MLEPVNPEELVKSLASRDSEDQWYEFKENLSNPDDIGEYISSLANSAMLADKRKAYLIFGVQDKTHKIVGTRTRLKTMKKSGDLLANYLNRLLKPSINFLFSSFDYEGKRVEIISIEPAYDRPVKFKNVAYVRVESAKRRLDDCPEKERSLWILTSRYSFEEGIAASNLSKEQIWEQFQCRDIALLLFKREIPQQTIFENFVSSGLILDNLQGSFDVTNLFALVAADDLSKYKTLSNKAPRVIVYKGQNKEVSTFDMQGQYGYAVTFEKLLKFIMTKIQGKEVFLHGIRTRSHRHPEIAVREFLANALIHQDLVASGYGPRIEIFTDKMKITNPGSPLIDTKRFIDAPAKSRNEKLAKLLRECGLCEERGSGVGRACRAIESKFQASPLFENIEDSTVVTLFQTSNYLAMSNEDRIRACYQHAQLQYLEGNPISNSTLRRRLGLNKNQSASATGVINDTIKTKLIKPVDSNQGNKNSRYVPYYAN